MCYSSSASKTTSENLMLDKDLDDDSGAALARTFHIMEPSVNLFVPDVANPKQFLLSIIYLA